MNYWIISDTHFNHTKLEEWGGRSGTWQTQLYEGISRIPEGDTLIHLGDICIGNDEEIHKQLAHVTIGVKKILIRGNHDKKSAQWYLDHGWDFVLDGMALLFHGRYLYFSNRPTPVMYNFTENIHGHTHGNLHRSEEYVAYYEKSYHKDISPEIVGYRPLMLKTFVDTFK